MLVCMCLGLYAYLCTCVRQSVCKAVGGGWARGKDSGRHRPRVKQGRRVKGGPLGVGGSGGQRGGLLRLSGANPL